MIFNDFAFDVLDAYRTGRISKDKALTKLNHLVDYVINSEANDRNKSVIKK